MPASSPAFTSVRRATTEPRSVKLWRNTCSTTRSTVGHRRSRRARDRRGSFVRATRRHAVLPFGEETRDVMAGYVDHGDRLQFVGGTLYSTT